MAYPPGAKIPKFLTRITLCCGEIFEFSDTELDVKGREAYQAIADKVMQKVSEIDKP